MELELKGKKALITGGSKGIGLAIKKSLEAEGVDVISWSRSEGVDVIKDINIRDFPNVDLLINNVGGMGTCDYLDSWICMKKNYGVTMVLTEEFLKLNKPWGRVITIGSIYGTYPGQNPWFASAKAAQIMLMKSLAGKHDGITFNCISPAEVSDAGIKKNVKLGAKDVADLVVFLCSDKAKMINGQNIVIGEFKNG